MPQTGRPSQNEPKENNLLLFIVMGVLAAIVIIFIVLLLIPKEPDSPASVTSVVSESSEDSSEEESSSEDMPVSEEEDSSEEELNSVPSKETPSKPVSSKQVSSKPVSSKPVSSKPASSKPVSSSPSSLIPASSETVTSTPSSSEASSVSSSSSPSSAPSSAPSSEASSAPSSSSNTPIGKREDGVKSISVYCNKTGKGRTLSASEIDSFMDQYKWVVISKLKSWDKEYAFTTVGSFSIRYDEDSYEEDVKYNILDWKGQWMLDDDVMSVQDSDKLISFLDKLDVFSGEIQNAYKAFSGVSRDDGVVRVTVTSPNGKINLTAAQIKKFMTLYDAIGIQFDKELEFEPTLNGAGFIIYYDDGSSKAYYVGSLYDGLWRSGKNMYKVDKDADALEKYLMTFDVFSGYVNS